MMIQVGLNDQAFVFPNFELIIIFLFCFLTLQLIVFPGCIFHVAGTLKDGEFGPLRRAFEASVPILRSDALFPRSQIPNAATGRESDAGLLNGSKNGSDNDSPLRTAEGDPLPLLW
jgi:hypothetical protein